MDDKDWVALKTIAEEKNITKAAERLFISQSALTYRLQNMEKEFKAKLFSRHAKGVQLTPQGEKLLAYAQDMLSGFRKAKESIASMQNKVQGTLRLGSSSVFAHYELPRILKDFLQLYPEVEISLKTGLSAPISRLLQKEEISVAISRGDHNWAGEKFLMRAEPLCLVNSGPLEIAELPLLPQIRYRTDSSLEQDIKEWWNGTFSRPPRITMEVDSMDACRQMVLNGLGWAILPAIGLGKQDGLFTRPLFWPDGRPLERKTWLLYFSSSLELPAVHAFVSYIKKRFKRKASV